MNERAVSLGRLIDELARRHGSPDAFVRRVRESFTGRGVSLDQDASSFRQVVEETFGREELVRTSTTRARASMANLHGRLDRLQEQWQQQLRSLEETRDLLERQAVVWRRTAAARRALVPGPHDVQ
jgi:hypothetical protein